MVALSADTHPVIYSSSYVSQEPKAVLFFADNDSDDNQTLETSVLINATSTVTWASIFGNIDVQPTDGGVIDLFSDPRTNSSIYIDGLAKSLHSLMLTDLGQSSDTNLFASSERSLKFMNQSMQFASQALDRDLDDSWHDMGYTEGTNFNLSQISPTTIDTQYLCQVPRLKSAGPLFISVVVPVFVFLQIIWALFSWTMAYFLERQHPDARYCVGCAKAVALGQLDLDASVSSSSSPKSKLEPELDRSDRAALINVAAPESILTWSDSIIAGSDMDTPHAVSSAQRRNEGNSYFLMARS